MKFTAVILFAFFLFFSCTKNEIPKQKLIEGQSSVSDIYNTTSYIPLNDLGRNKFMDSVGGLYPGGLNNPKGKYARDLMTFSKNIVPLDTFGNPSNDGYVLFLSLGGSTGGHNMKALRDKTRGNPATNPYIKILNANNGTGQANLNAIASPDSPYWSHVTQILTGNAEASYRQVQFIYLETDEGSKNRDWPDRPLEVKQLLEEAMRTIKSKFPNIKIVYVLGRTHTFDVTAPWNREPCPYYFGWSCKWAIQDQINGDPGMKYKGKNAVAPLLAWGFYQWADSTPRKTDGFSWLPSETADGLHANEVGQDTLSSRFQQFLLNDKYANNWYANHENDK